MKHYRVEKYYYRGGEQEIKHRFYIVELKFTLKSIFTGRYYWTRIRELVGSHGDCWYEDRSYDNLEDALTFIDNLQTPLPESIYIKNRSEVHGKL